MPILKTNMIKYHLYKNQRKLKTSYSLVDPEAVEGQAWGIKIQIAKDLKFYKNSLHDGNLLRIFLNDELHKEVRLR